MINVLVIDDSSIVHILLEKTFSEIKDIRIVGNAYDGEEGIEMAVKLSPDVIIMDIGMPKMNGLEAIKEIMYVKPTPVIVFSSASGNTIDLSFKAIELGAVELIEKPFAEDFNQLRMVIEDKLIKSIRTFADFKVMRRIKHHEPVKDENRQKDLKNHNDSKISSPMKHPDSIVKPDGFPVIGIAASTGGPQTIKRLLKGFPIKEMGAGVVIVQHMAEGFVQGLCDWLKEESPFDITLAKEGEHIEPARIYIAPERYHLVFDGSGKFLLQDSPPIVSIRPSADLMFESLGKVYKKRVIAIVLTGMGGDGSKGLYSIKENGGYIIAQDEESSLIFGMPKMAIDTGLVDRVLGLDKISEFLMGLYYERFGSNS